MTTTFFRKRLRADRPALLGLAAFSLAFSLFLLTTGHALAAVSALVLPFLIYLVVVMPSSLSTLALTSMILALGAGWIASLLAAGMDGFGRFVPVAGVLCLVALFTDEFRHKGEAKKAGTEIRLAQKVARILTSRIVLPEGEKFKVNAIMTDKCVAYEVPVPAGLDYRTMVSGVGALKEVLEGLHITVDADTRHRRGGLVVYKVFHANAFEDAGTVSSPIVENLGAPVAAWDKVAVGQSADFKPVSLGLPGQTVLIGGSPGSGKSAMTWQLLLSAGLDPTNVLCVIDLKPEGVETGPIADRADYYVTDHGDPDAAMDEALELLNRLDAEMSHRYKVLKERGKEKVTPADKGLPPITLFIDEAAQFVMSGAEGGKEALRLLTRLVQVGRAAGIGVVLITQKPDSSVIPTALRDLMGQRICFRTGNAEQARTILGDLGEGVEPQAISVDSPGEGYIKTEGEALLFKSFYVTREQQHLAAKVATDRHQDHLALNARYELAEAREKPQAEEETTGRKPRQPRKPRQARN